MGPDKNAVGDIAGTPPPRSNTTNGIVLHASKVAIHVRSRSPGHSPNKYYVPLSGSLGQDQDVHPQLDVNDRGQALEPIFHLEVDQKRRSSAPHAAAPTGSGKVALPPRATVDVFRVNKRSAVPTARPQSAFGPAAVSITLLPSGSATRTAASSADVAAPAASSMTAVAAGRKGSRPAVQYKAVQPADSSGTSTSGGVQTSVSQPLVPGNVSTTVGTSAPGGGSAALWSAAPFTSGRRLGPQGPPSDTHTGAGAAGMGAGLGMADASTGAGAALLAELLGPGAAVQLPRPGALNGGAVRGAPTVVTTKAAAAAAATVSAATASGASRPQQVPSGQGALLMTFAAAVPSASSRDRTLVPAAGGGGGAGEDDTWLLGPGLAPGLSPGLWQGSVWGVGASGPGWPDVPDVEEEARRARRRHRRQVARIVVSHWKLFAGERLRALAARKHLHRRMLTAAFVAWQTEAAAARVRKRQAAVYDMKRSYLGLGRCVAAWSAAAKRLARLRALQQQMVLNWLLRLLRSCLRAWRGRCYYSAEKRRRRLQAWYYWCFSNLSRALHKWHTWAESRRAKARRAAWASQQRLAALCRKAFAAWRRRQELLRWKVEAETRAAAVWRRCRLRGTLRAWRSALSDAMEARVAACRVLEAAAAGMEAWRAAAAFEAWREYAADRRRRQQCARYSVAYMRRWRQLVTMWGWRQQVARSKHLRFCTRVLERVGRRARLALSWSRWVVTVEVLQGQRTSELRALVLLRGSWAAWRSVVEHRAAKRELLRLAQRRVGQVVAAAALAVWRARAAHWQVKASRWAQAAAWHRRRALTRLVQGWGREAARLVAKAAAVQAAALHWRRRTLRRAVRLWRRYAWRKVMKEAAGDHYLTRLLASALRGWLRHTRYKMRKELSRRRAVRHRYLVLLRSGLVAFRTAVERRRAKQADWADLARLHALRLARSAMAAWRGEFVPLAAAKRAVQRRAEGHRRGWLLRCAVHVWRQQAARLAAKHAREREACGFASLHLLRCTLRRWAAAPVLLEARREAKAARLAELRAALAVAAVRRLLAAWREVHSDLVMKSFLISRAATAWRRGAMRRAVTCWALHLARRRASHQRNAVALTTFRCRTCRTVLAALVSNAQRRGAKRRLAVVASELRRTGLLRRALAALGWYGRYRAAKAQSYAAAHAAFVRRLQREGAVRWLEVGLEQRRQRIELLATVQARTLARQLALVEPFARRWLHAARSRRRRRLEAAGLLLAPTEAYHHTTTITATTASGMPAAAHPAFLTGAPAAIGFAAIAHAASGGVSRTTIRRLHGRHATVAVAKAGAPSEQVPQAAARPGQVPGQPAPQQTHGSLPLGAPGGPRVDDGLGGSAGVALGISSSSVGGASLGLAAVRVMQQVAGDRWPAPRAPLVGMTMSCSCPGVGAVAGAWGTATTPGPGPTRTGTDGAGGNSIDGGTAYRGFYGRGVQNTCAAAGALGAPASAVAGPKAVSGKVARMRPVPRCPDFLLVRRPATVGEAMHETVRHAPAAGTAAVRPASSLTLGVGSPEGARIRAPTHMAGASRGGMAPAVPQAFLHGGGASWAAPAPSPWAVASGTATLRSAAGGGHAGGHPMPLFFANMPPASQGPPAVPPAGAAARRVPAAAAERTSAAAAPSSVTLAALGAWSGGYTGMAEQQPPYDAPTAVVQRHGPLSAYEPLIAAPSPPPPDTCDGAADATPTVTRRASSSSSPSFASSPSFPGITIHQPGPRPPDVLRLPTRGETAAGEHLLQINDPSSSIGPTAGVIIEDVRAAVQSSSGSGLGGGSLGTVWDGAPTSTGIPAAEAARLSSGAQGVWPGLAHDPPGFNFAHAQEEGHVEATRTAMTLSGTVGLGGGTRWIGTKRESQPGGSTLALVAAPGTSSASPVLPAHPAMQAVSQTASRPAADGAGHGGSARHGGHSGGTGGGGNAGNGAGGSLLVGSSAGSNSVARSTKNAQGGNRTQLQPQQPQSQLQPTLAQSQALPQLHGPSPQQQQQQQRLQQRPAALPEMDEQELSELEAVLLHCKHLKGLLQQLEGATGVFDSLEQAQGQAAEVRAALMALRPTVEYAAARLRHIRGLAG